MANIFDYLKRRGVMSFKDDPFNEVDNLVLAMVSYTDFNGILEDSFKTISLSDADKEYFAKHSRAEAKKSIFHFVRAPLLMDDMLKGERFRDTVLTKYVDIINSDKDMQMSAVTFLLNDGSAYVAFRGTDTTVAGWKEDFNMSYLPETEGQLRAVRYLNEVGAEINRPLRVGGHSKGGNFAVYAAAFCEREIQDRILAVYTNDGPGFRSEIMEREAYKRIIPRVVSIVPDTSIVGMLLTSSTGHTIVKSKDAGLLQHDAFTWMIERNRFRKAKQSAIGSFINSSQKEWLSKLDDESRETFVKTLFSVFEATGMETFDEMVVNRRTSAEKILASIKNLPEEKQAELKAVMGELLQSSSNVIKRNIRYRRKKAETYLAMEAKYYVVERIDGDYAWLKRIDKDAEPIFIARALLPEGINEGTKLKQEFLQYEIIEG